MFSFVGDTVLDPFMGSGTANLAALKWGRNSIGVELVGDYLDLAARRFLAEPRTRVVRPGYNDTIGGGPGGP